VPIYAIGLLQTQRIMNEGRMGPIANMDFLQADNQMKTFASETGGRAFFPRFDGEMPGIFQAVHQSLRNQYTLTYQPTNQTKDGKFRRLKVELVNADNQPLKVVDEKGKPMKVQIISKAGYKAPREVE
jgi:Ca-activated chloride channel family protein